jgi:hypothetical protein
MPSRLVGTTPSLLRDRHGDALAALGAAAAENLSATAGLLARAEAMGTLPALVMRLIGSLAHGTCSRVVGTGSIRGQYPGVKVTNAAVSKQKAADIAPRHSRFVIVTGERSDFAGFGDRRSITLAL